MGELLDFLLNSVPQFRKSVYLVESLLPSIALIDPLVEPGFPPFIQTLRFFAPLTLMAMLQTFLHGFLPYNRQRKLESFP